MLYSLFFPGEKQGPGATLPRRLHGTPLSVPEYGEGPPFPPALPPSLPLGRGPDPNFSCLHQESISARSPLRGAGAGRRSGGGGDS